MIILEPGTEAFEALKAMLSNPSTTRVRIAVREVTGRVLLKQNEGMWTPPLPVEVQRHDLEPAHSESTPIKLHDGTVVQARLIRAEQLQPGHVLVSAGPVPYTLTVTELIGPPSRYVHFRTKEAGRDRMEPKHEIWVIA